MEEIKFISSCQGSMKPLRKEQTDDSCSDSPERGSYQWVGAPCPAHSHFWHSYKFIVFLFCQTSLILYKYFDSLNVVGIAIIFVNLWNKVTVILCISSNPLIVNIVNYWTPYTYIRYFVLCCSDLKFQRYYDVTWCSGAKTTRTISSNKSFLNV